MTSNLIDDFGSKLCEEGRELCAEGRVAYAAGEQLRADALWDEGYKLLRAARRLVQRAKLNRPRARLPRK